MEFKSIDDLSKKIAVQGTEKIPVSPTEYVDTEQIKEYINSNSRSYTPTIPYANRVLADSGVISDLEKLTKLYVENLKLLDNTVFMWDGSAGTKTRTSGINQYVTKLYDMSAGNKDAVQSTEANQPFVGGGIAPNESKSLKCVDGTIKYISHDKISFTDGQEWAVTFALNYTGHSTEDNKVICSGDSGWLAWRLKYNLYFRNSAGTINVSPTLTDLYGLFGKTAIHNVQAKGGNVYWYINNQLWHTFTGINTAFSFQNIFNASTVTNTSINGTISHYQIFNKALSASEIQAQYAYLRLQHPEIEGIDIGNQHWATSNYEGVVTGNGTVIPEVQDNAAWAALTTPAWCYYNNDPLNGAVYGKLYNWYAIQAIAANPPAGWRVPTLADFTQLATYLGGASVAGGKLKKDGLTYWTTPNSGATNESGFSAIGAGRRVAATGMFDRLNQFINLNTSDGYTAYTAYDRNTLTIIPVTQKEGGSLRLIRNEPVGTTTEVLDDENIPVKKTDGLIKFLSWANVKATLKTYFDTLYEKLSNKQNSLAVDGTGVKYPTVDAVNEGLALKADTVDVMQNKQSIATLESILSDVNINQEAQVTASGVDTVALPKTAANTGMQVQLFGQSAENLVVNGDFRDGTTGWTTGASTLSVVSGNLLNTASGSAVNPRTFVNITGVNGNKFYGVVRFRFTSSDTLSMSFGVTSASNAFGSISTPVQNRWYTVSNVITWGTDAGIRIQHNYSTPEAAAGKVMEIDYCYVINLTTTFGAGNEPNKAQCNLLFANYFEGTANTIGTGRVRGVGVGGINPSSLYFNGGTLRSNGLIKDEIRKGANGYELVKRVGVGTLGTELTVNSGAEGQTDWVDSNGDGLADGQSVWNYSPSGWVASIVTGNGFVGNAQRIEGEGHLALNTPWMTAYQSYFISFKYRSSHAISFQTGGSINLFSSPANTGNAQIRTAVLVANANGFHQFRLLASGGTPSWLELDEISIKRLDENDGLLTGNEATKIGSNIHYTLATPVITPIAHAGLLNSNSNGTVYFEPAVADAGVYGSNMPIQLTDFPISAIESISKYEDGLFVPLNPATAVIAVDGLSFTHPDLASGDLVTFTYLYDLESTGRSMTLTHYDSRYVVKDTANDDVYKITPKITSGLLTWELTLV